MMILRFQSQANTLESTIGTKQFNANKKGIMPKKPQFSIRYENSNLSISKL